MHHLPAFTQSIEGAFAGVLDDDVVDHPQPQEDRQYQHNGRDSQHKEHGDHAGNQGQGGFFRQDDLGVQQGGSGSQRFHLLDEGCAEGGHDEQHGCCVNAGGNQSDVDQTLDHGAAQQDPEPVKAQP